MLAIIHIINHCRRARIIVSIEANHRMFAHDHEQPMNEFHGIVSILFEHRILVSQIHPCHPRSQIQEQSKKKKQINVDLSFMTNQSYCHLSESTLHAILQ